jgi:hypothetical protein
MFQDLWNKKKIPGSMKTKQVCIWSALWKHGWILLKLGMQVSIEGMIENENRVKKSSQKLCRLA